MHAHIPIAVSRARHRGAGFTLIELVVSMSIFAIMMLVMINIFSSAQKAWSAAAARTEMFENARIALDIMAGDFQNAYYQNGVTPFWHWEPTDITDPGTTGAWGEQAKEGIAFISSTKVKQDCYTHFTRLYEIKYNVPYSTDPHLAGWLRRSVTGDQEPGNKWNFLNNFTVGKGTAAGPPPNGGLTADDTSSAEYKKLIPNVVEFNIECYRQDGTPLLPFQATGANGGNDLGLVSEFPYSLKIDLSLLSGHDWNKYVMMSGADPANPSGDADPAMTFRINNQRSFTRMVIIGDRGQY